WARRGAGTLAIRALLKTAGWKHPCGFESHPLRQNGVSARRVGAAFWFGKGIWTHKGEGGAGERELPPGGKGGSERSAKFQEEPIWLASDPGDLVPRRRELQTPIPLGLYRPAGVAATDPWGFESHPLRHSTRPPRGGLAHGLRPSLRA